MPAPSKGGAARRSRVLESSCVARSTAAFSVRLDIRSGHPAENSTELRINGDSTPHGQNWLRRKTSLSRLGTSRNGDKACENTPCLAAEGVTASGEGDHPAAGSVRLTRDGFLVLGAGRHCVRATLGLGVRVPSGFSVSWLARAAHAQAPYIVGPKGRTAL